MRSQPLKVLETLFPGKARRAALEALFMEDTESLSMSELARRANLTPRAVAVEIKKLEEAGLVSVESIGSAYVVRPIPHSVAAKALRELLKAIRTPPPPLDMNVGRVRRALVAYGAPLAETPEPSPTLSLTDALLYGLKLARGDATVFRTLPVMVVKQLKNLDWNQLKDRARHMRLKAELGMLLDLTAQVAGKPSLHTHASELFDRRRKQQEYFPTVANKHEKQLADQRTPPVVKRWGFRMNMQEESFRSALNKHA